MSAPAWMPLYIADYLADTGHLSTREHGAYLLLIMHYWQNGGLPTDDAKLARICRATPKEWAAIRDTIAALFGENWTHKRIETEIEKAGEIATKRSEAGRLAGRASAASRQRRVDQTLNDPSTQRAPNVNPLPSPTPEDNKEDARRKGRAPPKAYAFEGRTIRLTKADYDRWVAAFTNLSLDAELLALDEWASQQKDWFHAVSAALAKRNREAGDRVRAIKAEAEARGRTPAEPTWDPRL